MVLSNVRVFAKGRLSYYCKLQSYGSLPMLSLPTIEKEPYVLQAFSILRMKAALASL